MSSKQEKLILNGAFCSREVWDKLPKLLAKEELSLEGQSVLSAIDEFYDTDPAAATVDKSVLENMLERKYPKHADKFIGVVNEFEELSSAFNVLKEIHQYKLSIAGMDLGAKLLNPNVNAKLLEDALDKYVSLRDSEISEDAEEDGPAVYVGASADDLRKSLNKDNLIQVWPKALNQRLGGGVPPGTHIGVIALPEAGKTAFALNMAAGFVKKGKKVLYFANEEAYTKYKERIVSRLSGMVKSELEADPERAVAAAKENGLDNFLLVDLKPGTFKEIEQLILKHEPACVIYDQLRQIHIHGADGDVAQLTKAAKEARRLGKKYNLVTVSLTQAADSATNKLVLDIGDVFMSNVTFPGDVDVLIGIGKNDAFEAGNRRMLSLIKNKITGQHGAFPVVINPALSQYISEK